MGLQRGLSLLEETVAGRLTGGVRSQRRSARLARGRGERVACQVGDLDVPSSVLRRIIDGRVDTAGHVDRAAGLPHAAHGKAALRVVDGFVTAARRVFARPEGKVGNVHGIELAAHRFRLGDLPGGQGSADVSHEDDRLLPRGLRRPHAHWDCRCRRRPAGPARDGSSRASRQSAAAALRACRRRDRRSRAVPRPASPASRPAPTRPTASGHLPAPPTCGRRCGGSLRWRGRAC